MRLNLFEVCLIFLTKFSAQEVNQDKINLRITMVNPQKSAETMHIMSYHSF